MELEEAKAELQEKKDFNRHTESKLTEKLKQMENELAGLRHQAVQQLVAERLQANESFRIFQTLLASSQQAVRRRIDQRS